MAKYYKRHENIDELLKLMDRIRRFEERKARLYQITFGKNKNKK